MNTASNSLEIYTITFNGRDFPGKYVVRKHLVPGGVTDDYTVHDSLRDARFFGVPVGLVRFDRDPNDDKVIVELWL